MKQLQRKGRIWNWSQFHKWKDREETKLEQFPIIGKETTVFGIGSCFAENVVTHLRIRGVEANFFPGGTRFYDSKSIEQTLLHLFEKPTYSDDDFYQVDDGVFGNPFRLPDKRYESLDALRADDRSINDQARKLFTEADVIIVTIGGTELWRHPKTKKAYSTIPFPDVFNQQMPDIAEPHNLTFQENYNAIENIAKITKSNNPKAKLIFTVSPNRMTFTVSKKDIVQANCQGKSVLRAAVGEYCDRQTTHVQYFHSYELLEYCEQPKVVYDRHMRHVSTFGVQVVMNEFFHYFGKTSIRDEAEYEKIRSIFKDKVDAAQIPEYVAAIKLAQEKDRVRKRFKNLRRLIRPRLFS